MMCEDKIVQEIEKLRGEMVKLCGLYGFNNSKVIDISEKIDLLHNKLVKIQKAKELIKSNEDIYTQSKKDDNKIKEGFFHISYCY